MSKVYAFLADGLEEVECLGAMDILVRAGVEVTLVSVTGSRQVTGAHGFTITADKLFEETDPAEADVLFLPGGMPGTKNLAAFEPLMEAVRQAAADGLLYEFREMGAVLQMNKGSVFGRFGKEAERTAHYLLENRLAGCAASDAHRADYRTPDMKPIREFLSEWYGESYAELLLKVNPRRILENRPVLYEPSPERRRKRRWFV